MPTNIDDIFVKCIEVADMYVGQYLAQQSNGAGGTLPAIYKQVDPNPKGKYPFITVNVSGPVQQTNRSLYSYINDSDDMTTGSCWDFIVTYAVYSSNYTTTSAQQIAFELSERLSTIEALEEFQDVGEVAHVYPITTNRGKRDNEVFEFASFTLKFTTYSEVVNENTYLMNEVNAGLGLRIEGAEENEVDVSISVQQPPP